jgi:hypothetical protein
LLKAPTIPESKSPLTHSIPSVLSAVTMCNLLCNKLPHIWQLKMAPMYHVTSEGQRFWGSAVSHAQELAGLKSNYGWSWGSHLGPRVSFLPPRFLAELASFSCFPCVSLHILASKARAPVRLRYSLLSLQSLQPSAGKCSAFQRLI